MGDGDAIHYRIMLYFLLHIPHFVIGSFLLILAGAVAGMLLIPLIR